MTTQSSNKTARRLQELFDLKGFFPQNIAAITTDNALDFSMDVFPGKLTPEQNNYLEKIFNQRIDSFYSVKQIHTDNIINFTNRGFDPQKIDEADAVITSVKGVLIAVRTADCLPIFMHDDKNHAIAIVHAGWKGTQLKIGAKTLRAMEEHFGTRPSHVKVVFGPCIRPCCYSVGEEFTKTFPAHVTRTAKGLCFNLASANRADLLDAGIADYNILDCAICTCCDHRYFSFRRQKEEAGRMLSVIIMKK